MSWLQKNIAQTVGKVRRFFQARFAKEYVKAQHEKRQGECIRCGACCRLLIKCPMLKYTEDGNTMCVAHDKRPQNCRIFPVNKKDLAERDFNMPDKPCGFSFPDDE